MTSVSIDVVVATAQTVALASVKFLIVALAAMAICLLLEKAEKRFPDRPLWRTFRLAALSLALIDLLILVLVHGLHAISEVIA